jgi:hypothetical protein
MAFGDIGHINPTALSSGAACSLVLGQIDQAD